MVLQLDMSMAAHVSVRVVVSVWVAEAMGQQEMTLQCHVLALRVMEVVFAVMLA
jgi:hypothetical protein